MRDVSIEEVVRLLPLEAGIFLGHSCGYERFIQQYDASTAVEEIYQYIFAGEQLTEEHHGQPFWVTDHSLSLFSPDGVIFVCNHPLLMRLVGKKFREFGLYECGDGRSIY